MGVELGLRPKNDEIFGVVDSENKAICSSGGEFSGSLRLIGVFSEVVKRFDS